MINRIGVLMLVSLMSNGCFLPRMAASAIGSDATRARELNETVSNFHTALYWGSPAEAAAFVAPELQGSFHSDMVGDIEQGKVVDLKVEKVGFSPEGTTVAYVDTAVRFIRIPTYVVETTRKRETWDYSSFGGDWVLTKIEEKGTPGVKEPVDLTGKSR